MRLSAPVFRTIAVAFSLLAGVSAFAQPAPFVKSFSPNTIGPGSASTLQFTITSSSGSPITDLAFTDNLPAGVTIATPASASTTCTGATLSAPDGGGTIIFSDGSVGASSSCTVTVNVTSSAPGTHMNVSGSLTSSVGNLGTASADLTVTTGRPGFSKSFSPSSVAFGGRSTLTFTIDNSANGSFAQNLNFTDVFPSGIVIANPANLSNTCNSTVSASPGAGTLSNVGGFIPSGSTCAISVDVIGGAVGTLNNTTTDLSTFSGSSGKATASLTVTGSTDPILLVKDFTDDPVPPGGTVNLQLTITNTNRLDDATDIGFTDDLDATLSGLVATGLPATVCNGGTLSGTSLLTLSGASLPAGTSCTFNVALSVPAGATPGTYPNTTSTPTATIRGMAVAGNQASAALFVETFPVLTKSFTDDPVGSGGTVTLEFTITNTSSTSGMANIAFRDELTTFLPFPLSVGLPPTPDPPCGAGSSFSVFSPGGDRQALSLTNGSLAASGSCTFSVTVDIPDGFPGGIYTNTTEPITAELTNEMNRVVTGPAASDDLVTYGAPLFNKEFTDDPTAPGGQATLDFTIEHDGLAPGDATAIAFTDDLNATLSGLSFNSVISNTCGGTASGTGTSTITYGGGSLTPGSTCTLSVLLDVPAGALAGVYSNTTSDITATVGGVSVTGNPAVGDFRVAGLTLFKEFIDDPAIPGDTTTLRFTLDNTSGTSDATGIAFTDNLADVLPGTPDLTVSTALPAPFCNGTLSLSGSTLVFSGGSVTSGTSCPPFDVALGVPAGASDGTYNNVTSNLSATLGMTPTTLPPAADALTIDSDLLAISKSFTDDPAVPGGTVTLDLTLTNLDATRAASAIAFTDDLDATLSGLTINSILSSNCGGTPSGGGTGLFDLSGGTLAGGASCTISLLLDIPAGPLPGDSFVNTTSTVTGTINGFAVSGPPASDTLEVNTTTLAKAFSGVGFAGQTVDLTFTITNLDSSAGVSPLSFTDSLPGGLVATSLPATPCGAGSQITGTSFLTFSGGNLTAGGSCSFSVTLQVPVSASPGSYVNTTSDLLSSGLSIGGAATDTLVVEPAPNFSKAFAPATIGLSQTSTLTFTIDNTGSTVAATGLAFTDNLPASVAVASTPNASTTCTGGTLTALADAGTISYTGGTVADGSTCTVEVDVVGNATGMHVNVTGDLTSSSGNSGTATDTLTVDPQPGFAKAFSPNPIAIDSTSVLTFAIDNTGSTSSASLLDFTDNLPAGIVVATPANASTNCSGGTITATAGSGTVSYTGGAVAASSDCTVQVDVTGSTAGDFINISGSLTSSLGDSGTATDTLTIVPAPTFAKAFNPAVIPSGATSTLTFTIDNTASALDATSLDFTDNLPAGVVVATPANASTTCSGGTITATAGTGSISYAGGSVTGGTSCTVQADVTSSTVGDYVNTSGSLTSSLGDSGTATDTLSVISAPIFTKVFSPDTIDPGQVTTLTFTIDNSANGADATSLDFTDNLPADLLVANPANASTTCTGGTLTATAGTGTISYTGGTVAATSSCTISVDVTSSVAGLHVNTTGDLTSSFGNSNNASDTLTVTQPLSLTKEFIPSSVIQFGITTVILTLDNASGILDATGVGVTDNLPAGLAVADPANAMTTCVGGTLTATPGASSFSYTGGTVPAGTTCVVEVDVIVNEFGNFVNVTEDLSSSFGNSGPASATLGAGMAEIPTLDEWALILMALLLALPAVWILRD